MDANEVALLAVSGTVLGQKHVHTLHFKLKVGAAATPLSDLAAEWEARCGASYRALFRTDASPVQQIAAKQVCGSVPLDADAFLVPASALGTRPNGDGLANAAPFLAQLVHERSAYAGRSRRGRYFIGGLTEQDLEQDAIGTSAGSSPPQRGNTILAYNTALLTAFLATNALTVWSLVIYSPTLAAVPGTQCQDSSTEVTTLQLSPFLTTMRSRKLGHGT